MHSKQSCFIMPPPHVLWKEEAGRMGRFQTLAWCFCQIFFIYSFLFCPGFDTQTASQCSFRDHVSQSQRMKLYTGRSKQKHGIYYKQIQTPHGGGGGGGVEEGIGEGWVANLTCLRVFIYYGPILSVSFSDWLLLSSLSSNNFKNQLLFPIFLPLSSLEAFCTWRINSFVLWHPVFCKTNISMVLASSNGHFCTSSFPCPYPVCPFAFNSSQCPLQSGNPNCCWEQGQWPLKLLPAE